MINKLSSVLAYIILKYLSLSYKLMQHIIIETYIHIPPENKCMFNDDFVIEQLLK